MKKKRRLKLPEFQKTLCSIFVSVIFVSIFWLVQNFPTLEATRQPQFERPAELYANQNNDDLRRIYLRAINSAQKSIYFIIYALTDPQIIHALQVKSEEGIDVCIVCDPKASPQLQKKLGSKVDVCRRYGLGLMHQKILIVDGLNCWIGSANMTTESLRMHGNLVTGFRSPEMAAWLRLKGAAMSQESIEMPIFPHQEFDVGGQKVEICFLPDDTDAVQRVKQLIQTAEKTVRVAMFTWTRQDFAKAIVDAQKRGVEADVVMDYLSGKGANAKVLELLIQKKVPVALSQGNALLHHKFLYIDGKTLVNGSANWTAAAFTKNDDCFIILHDLTENQKQFLDSLWAVIKAESEAQIK